MAKYRVLEKSFINNSLVDEGTIVEFDGVPSANLEPLDTAAVAAVESPEAAHANADSLARMQEAAKGVDAPALTEAPVSGAQPAAASLV